MSLAEEIEAAENKLDQLRRRAASASCIEVGHDWKQLGGSNCGCHEDACCSVPVYACTKCKDCDYGDNDEARKMRDDCRQFGPPQ